MKNKGLLKEQKRIKKLDKQIRILYRQIYKKIDRLAKKYK